METQTRDLGRELHQEPDSDGYLLRSETFFDNPLDNLETIAVFDGNRQSYQRDTGKERLCGESGVEENVQGEEQDLEDKILFGSSDDEQSA